jgi:hypothetical protein
MSTLPVIDLAGGERRVAREIEAACRDSHTHGFDQPLRASDTLSGTSPPGPTRHVRQ